MNSPDIASYFSGRLLAAIEKLPPTLISKTEVELVTELGPTPLDYALRRNFWKAVETARAMNMPKIHVSAIYNGACSRNYFEENFMQKPLKVAWLTRPIIPHEAYYETLNKVAIQKLLDYISNNEVSEKNLGAIIKIAEAAANRAYGAVVQKIQTKNLNLEGRIPDQEKPAAVDVQQLTERANELQAKLLESAKDVTPPDPTKE